MSCKDINCIGSEIITDERYPVYSFCMKCGNTFEDGEEILTEKNKKEYENDLHSQRAEGT